MAVLFTCPDCFGDGKETCHNPDHGFINALSFHEVGRLGCPVCGHNEKHKVRGGGNCETCAGDGSVDLNTAQIFCEGCGYDWEDAMSSADSGFYEKIDAARTSPDARQEENEALKARVAELEAELGDPEGVVAHSDAIIAMSEKVELENEALKRALEPFANVAKYEIPIVTRTMRCFVLDCAPMTSGSPAPPNREGKAMADVTLWAVSCNDDLTEGRGREYIKFFCRTEATAIRLAKRGYVQGTDCPVYPVKALILDGKHVLPISLINVVEPSAVDEAVQKRIDAAANAVAKAKSLGLSDDDIAAIIKSGGSHA